MPKSSVPDQPRTDRLGRPRSPATMPGFRQGKKPGNAGRILPAEAIGEDDLQQLMTSISRTSATGKRNRAMVWLMYLGLKVHQIEALQPRDCLPGADRVVIPPRIKRGEPTIIQLDRFGREVMAEWWATRKALKIPATRPLFCTIAKGSGWGRVAGAYMRTMLKDTAEFAGIHRRVTPQGLVLTGREHRGQGSLSFENHMQAYINTSFRQRYPVSHAKWRGAQALFLEDPRAHATNIGNGCREALQTYAEALTEEHPAALFDASAASTTKIRQVLASQEFASETVTQHVDAVVAYWSAVNKLAQRQVHDEHAVGVEDTRRLIFHTMLVMYEVDGALNGIA